VQLYKLPTRFRRSSAAPFGHLVQSSRPSRFTALGGGDARKLRSEQLLPNVLRLPSERARCISKRDDGLAVIGGDVESIWIALRAQYAAPTSPIFHMARVPYRRPQFSSASRPSPRRCRILHLEPVRRAARILVKKEPRRSGATTSFWLAIRLCRFPPAPREREKTSASCNQARQARTHNWSRYCCGQYGYSGW
jgi:hypothetical protein